jgi:hypothetical protein
MDKEKKKKRLAPLLGAIAYLKGHSLCGAGVIGAYHWRRVAPLMARALPLYGMALACGLRARHLLRVCSTIW